MILSSSSSLLIQSISTWKHITLHWKCPLTCAVFFIVLLQRWCAKCEPNYLQKIFEFKTLPWCRIQHDPLSVFLWWRCFEKDYDSKLHSNAFWIRPHTHDVPTLCQQSLTWWWDRHLPLSFPAPPLFPLVTGVNIFRLRPSQPLCVCVCVCVCVCTQQCVLWMDVCPRGKHRSVDSILPLLMKITN